MTEPAIGSMSVLRIYHSAVVTAWRERDRQLRELGVRVLLLTARRWNEGGKDVPFEAAGDCFVRAVATCGRHPYGFLYDPRPLYRALRDHRFSVIDVHEEPASLAALEVLVLRLLARQPAPIVFYGAQNIEKRFPPPFRWIERWALRTAAGAHCCNDEAGRIFRRKGLRGEIVTLGLGVDIGSFTPSDRRRTPNEPFRIGYVGRLEDRKGVPLLVRCLAALPGAELHLVGDGPDAGGIAALARRLGVHDRVVSHGHCANDELPPRYRAMDVIAVPSRSTAGWVEQFGRVLVEAMASGVPVIGSTSGAIPEVLGDAGITVDEDDMDGWIARFTELAADPDRGHQLAAAGVARAARYTWPVIATEQLAFYRSVSRAACVAPDIPTRV